jgi:hypothetical protein
MLQCRSAQGGNGPLQDHSRKFASVSGGPLCAFRKIIASGFGNVGFALQRYGQRCTMQRFGDTLHLELVIMADDDRGAVPVRNRTRHAGQFGNETAGFVEIQRITTTFRNPQPRAIAGVVHDFCVVAKMHHVVDSGSKQFARSAIRTAAQNV